MTETREGAFWDVLAGRAPVPPVLSHLGWEVIEAEPGRVRARFQGREEFYNSAGLLQGGILGAMLDGVMGSAVVSLLGRGENVATLEMKVSYMRPCQAQPLVGEGRVVHRGRSILFTEGTLSTEDGSLVATGTATARVVPVPAADGGERSG